MNATFLDYAIVAALGALVGSGELVSRYRDAPAGALRTRPALFYILLNLAASSPHSWSYMFSTGISA